MKELSVGLSSAWQMAAREAAATKHQYIEKEHMLIGICSLEKIVLMRQEKIGLSLQTMRSLQVENDDVLEILVGFGFDNVKLRRQIREKLGEHNYQHIEKVIHRSEDCKKLFSQAETLATKTAEISCLHLLAALMEEPGNIIREILVEKPVNPSDLVKRALAAALKKESNTRHKPSLRQIHRDEVTTAENGTPFLDTYGRDLTREAQEGKLGPFIDRRVELLQLIQTMVRKTKNSPVLVGEAGVGKTAIVEALAVRVVQGKDQQVLGGKRIVELNMGSLLGGTRYRGDFEKRILAVIEEVRSHPEVIVFINEIHSVVGAGKGDGTMDAVSFLKPALSRGDLRIIGATTITEYRRYIESDPALERRFEKIIVNEPSPEEALDILRGITPKMEEYHQVRILDSALKAAVNLSIRFYGDHQLPDKAIDLVDKAAARTRIPLLSMKLENKEKILQRKDINEADHEEAVTELTIAQVLSDKTGVPLEIITGHLEGIIQSRILRLESSLKKRLIGQDEAIELVCQRILLAHSGLERRRGPLAVFMFLGPTGVGKTELARLLSEFLFGSKSDMIRLDMSEYMEEHSVAKLIGSPPGYIGYEDEGQLTHRMRSNPYSIILLDEVEKAHPRVLDLFLQVFDDGRLTDSKGRTIDAKNAIFVMTSNIKDDKSRNTPQIYDGARKAEGIREKLRQVMRPEFLNRIDELIVFKSLSKQDILKILKPILHKICVNVGEQQNVTLKVDSEAEEFLAKTGYSPDFGARELQRTVEKLVQIPLTSMILKGKLTKYSQWKIMRTNQGISIIQIDNKNDQGKKSHKIEHFGRIKK